MYQRLLLAQDLLRQNGSIFVSIDDDEVFLHPLFVANRNPAAAHSRREVLIFKMAVALGFDAPRAFTLVSMRASRDEDFGTQLLGRILRVHRLLHGRARAKSLPAPLNYGYVFLADPDTQAGIDKAGQLINRIQAEYAKASTATDG